MKLLIAFVAAAACLLASCSEPEQESVYFLPSELPASVNPVAQFACEVVRMETDPDSEAILGLRGLERLDSEEYTELPFLRAGMYRIGTPGTPMTLDDIATESADAGSSRPATVDGTPAIAFTITTAEPVTVAWPALAWIDNGVGITMLGEGFDDATVLEIAEAFEPVSREEFLEAAFDPSLCELVNQ